jgi:hypothetical protein
MLLRSLALLPLLTFVAAAQSPVSNWETVKSVMPGTLVRVASSTQSKPLQGSLDHVTDSDLVLRTSAGSQTVPRTGITGVSVKKRHRLRNTFIGLGIGTGAGLLIGFAVGHSQQSGCMKSGGWFCGLETGVDTAVGGAAGLVGGTIAGALWSGGGWRKIYAP